MKFTPEDQAAIAKYALWHGNKAAIRHFSKELGKEIKDSSVCTWKKKYSAELKRSASKRDSEEKGEVCVNSLPIKKRGRPLLLGENLDTAVKNYIKAVREAGGIINTSITIAAATAIVQKTDRSLLSENGGPITITTNWAKSLLYRLNFVKRRGSSTAKISVVNFEDLKEQYLPDIKAVTVMEEVPPELILNWDHTGRRLLGHFYSRSTSLVALLIRP